MSLSATRPGRERTDKQARDAAKFGAGEKRIAADVPEALHRKMHVRCSERGISVRAYIIELLEKDGVKV
jgi:predicted DNA binding CopG/RHH family protein